MNPNLLLAESNPQLIPMIAAIGAILFVSFLFVLIWASRYRKVGPDEVLVISGRKIRAVDAEGKMHVCGFRLVKGGGTFVFPVVEQVRVMSLKPVSLQLALARVAVRDGGSVRLKAQAQVRIKSDEQSLFRAAESVLGKGPDEVKEIAGQMLESAWREALGTCGAEEIVRNEPALPAQLQAAAQPRLNELGLEVLSLSVRELEVLAKGAAA